MKDFTTEVAEAMIDPVTGKIVDQKDLAEPGLVALFSALTGIAAAERTQSAARSFLSQRYPQIIGALADDIRERQVKGELATELDASSIARTLIAAADGLQTQWLIDPTVDMAADLERLWSAITCAPPT